MGTHSSILAWMTPWTEDLVGYSPGVHKESETTEQLSFWAFPAGSDGKESAQNAGHLSLILGLEDPLEEGMATLSSILAWKIPWIEEPGGLHSMGSQRVGQD